MGGTENENGMDLHDWSSYPFERDSALEDDSKVQIIKHHNNITYTANSYHTKTYTCIIHTVQFLGRNQTLLRM
jgi:hypothetical protein